MADLAEVLEGVALGRDGVGLRVVHPADDLDRVGQDLDGLPLALRLGDGARDGDRAAGRQAEDLGLVVRERRGGHDLERVEARPVVDVRNESPAFESRRVRIQPWTVARAPAAAGRRGCRRLGLPWASAGSPWVSGLAWPG